MDPLAQLKDIHTPLPIHNYPVAIGWWILAALIVVAIIWLWRKIRKTQKLKQHQKQALMQLQNPELNLEQIQSILKWAALCYFPREKVASLYGEQWMAFLQQNLPEKHQTKFTQLTEDTNWLEGHYETNNSQINLEEAKAIAKFWLSNALPIKPNSLLPANSFETKEVK